jgi:hypothetical protein
MEHRFIPTQNQKPSSLLAAGFLSGQWVSEPSEKPTITAYVKENQMLSFQKGV